MSDEIQDRDNGVWGWALLIGGILCIVVGAIMCGAWVVVNKLV